MAEIVNLRAARKARARNDSAAQADRNRAAFGRTKQEKRRAAEDIERRDKLLDGARRDDEPA